MVVNTALTWLPKAIRTEMATTEMKARIKAYSTRVLPFLLFIRRSAILALVIALLIIVFHLLSIKKCSKFLKRARLVWLVPDERLSINESDKWFGKGIERMELLNSPMLTNLGTSGCFPPPRAGS